MTEQSGVGAGPQASMGHGIEGRVVRALAGVNQYLPASSNLVLNGKAMSQPEIAEELQNILQLFADLRDLRAKTRGQLKTVQAGLIPGRALLTVLGKAMQAFHGMGNPLLAQYGFAVGDRKPRSGATQVRAQARSQLTRALRHTMGRRQRAAIQSVAPSKVTVGPDGTVAAVEALTEAAPGGSEGVAPQ